MVFLFLSFVFRGGQRLNKTDLIMRLNKVSYGLVNKCTPDEGSIRPPCVNVTKSHAHVFSHTQLPSFTSQILSWTLSVNLASTSLRSLIPRDFYYYNKISWLSSFYHLVYVLVQNNIVVCRNHILFLMKSSSKFLDLLCCIVIVFFVHYLNCSNY